MIIFLKRRTLIIILFAFSILPAFSEDKIEGGVSDTLTIIIKNIRDSIGNINAGIYKEDGYGKISLNKCFKSKVSEVKDSTITIKMGGIPKGVYAVTVWHDKNGNGKCGKYFIGFPSEDYGFSNNHRGRYGPPPFKESKFYYSGIDSTITIYIGDYYYSPPCPDTLAHKNSWVIAPFGGYTPESRMLLGINAARIFKFKGSGSKTRTSLADVFAIYTVNKQVIIEQNYTVFSKNGKWMDHGYSKYQKFPQYYFGIGNTLPESNKELISYEEIKLEHVLLRKVKESLFFGGGIRYNMVYNLTQPSGGILEQQHAIGNSGYRVAGLILAFSSDSRDNIYNSSKGHLIKLRANLHMKMFASQYEFYNYEVDIRRFIKPFKNRQDVLAFQFYNQTNTGNVPWNEMGALGNDMIMRGYYNGRYRDNNYAAMQMEYRMYLTRSFTLVTFVGTGEVASKFSSYNLYYLKPSYGAGLRFRIDNKEKLNLRFDYGFGKHTQNLYITVTEAF